jgi:hypothetical protein
VPANAHVVYAHALIRRERLVGVLSRYSVCRNYTCRCACRCELTPTPRCALHYIKSYNALEHYVTASSSHNRRYCRFARVVYILRLYICCLLGGGVHRIPTIIWCFSVHVLNRITLHVQECVQHARTQRCVIALTQTTHASRSHTKFVVVKHLLANKLILRVRLFSVDLFGQFPHSTFELLKSAL